jgi:type I restriction enzyme S subunit
LDDKIELNQGMNETLENMARVLFKGWFIDFDPVRAKAAGRDPGLPADIATLFPSSFEDSELGEIPKGWTVAPMGHLAEVTIGGDWGEDNPLADSVEAVCLRGVDLEHLRENGWADAPRRWFTTLSIEKRTLCARDVLVAGSGAGPTGRSLWAAPELDQLWGVPVLYSNFCKRLRCPSEASAIYLDRSLSIMRDSGEIWEYVNGTSVPNLDAGALLSGKMLVLPDGAILDAFARLIKEVSAHLFSPESRTLATVRDTLLPKLLSGELQIGNVKVDY